MGATSGGGCPPLLPALLRPPPNPALAPSGTPSGTPTGIPAPTGAPTGPSPRALARTTGRSYNNTCAAVIRTMSCHAALIEDLLSDAFDFVLTSRFKRDPLEKRYVNIAKGLEEDF